MLQSLIPSLIAGAVEIIRDKKAREENSKATSTKIAKVGGGLTAVAASAVVGLPLLEIDPGMTLQEVGYLLLASVVLYLYRRRGTNP